MRDILHEIVEKNRPFLAERKRLHPPAELEAAAKELPSAASTVHIRLPQRMPQSCAALSAASSESKQVSKTTARKRSPSQ